MKQLFLIIAFLLSITGIKAQTNPFEELGYTPRFATLSNGQFNEFHDNDTIVQIGSVLLNTKTKQIVTFVQTDTVYSEATLQPDIVSRWISPDPLAEKFASSSPYAAMGNNPIYYVDPDGRENIPALIWAAQKMANKGIPFNIWYGGDGGWTYKAGVIPTGTVCYESCWTSYMNGADASTMTTLKAGFSTKGGGFKGRSHETGGMNWFKSGDGTDRQFVSDITKGELGDIVFMGEVGDMAGHAVLLASDITKGTIKVGGKSIETMTFYSLSTGSDSDAGNYGGREFTFSKQSDGSWKQEGGSGYTFRGYGQMTNVTATDEQRKEATKVIEDVKKGN